MSVPIILLSQVIRFHSRKFSASSNPPKRSSPLRWVPLVVGGTCLGVGALEYFYPKSITAYIPFLKNNVTPEAADVKVKNFHNPTIRVSMLKSILTLSSHIPSRFRVFRTSYLKKLGSWKGFFIFLCQKKFQNFDVFVIWSQEDS